MEEIKTVSADPDTDWNPGDDGLPPPPDIAVGWDIAHSCRINFVTEEGVLTTLVHVAGETRETGVAKRLVTPEQLLDFAKKITNLANAVRPETSARTPEDTLDEATVEALSRSTLEEWLTDYTPVIPDFMPNQYRVKQIGDDLYEFTPSSSADPDLPVQRFRITPVATEVRHGDPR